MVVIEDGEDRLLQNSTLLVVAVVILVSVVIVVALWKSQKTVTPAMTLTEERPTNAEFLVESSVGGAFRRFDISRKITVQDRPYDVLAAGSLAGTSIDGDLKHDERGSLLVDKSVKNVFDYFLSTQGEFPLETIVEDIERYSREVLPDSAAIEVVDLFYDYLALKTELAEVMDKQLFSISSTNSNKALDELAAFFDMRSQLRQVHLGRNTATVFYGDEEAYDEYQIEKARLNLDETLSHDEKTPKLVALESKKLSPDLAASIQLQREFNQLVSSVSEQRMKGASDAEVYALRQQVKGDDYALKMAELELKRQEWTSRVSDYQKKRNEIQLSSMSELDKSGAIIEMQYSLFSETERLRLRAYAP